MDEWESARTNGPAKLPGIHRNYIWNISKGSKEQTGASTNSHDKAIRAWRTKAISFPKRTTVNTKQTNMFGDKSVFQTDDRSSYCQPSSVATHHSLATYASMIR